MRKRLLKLWHLIAGHRADFVYVNSRADFDPRKYPPYGNQHPNNTDHAHVIECSCGVVLTVVHCRTNWLDCDVTKARAIKAMFTGVPQ